MVLERWWKGTSVPTSWVNHFLFLEYKQSPYAQVGLEYSSLLKKTVALTIATSPQVAGHHCFSTIFAGWITFVERNVRFCSVTL